MNKNICIMGLVAAAMMTLTSCTLKVSAMTPTQNYNADIVVMPVEPYKK